MYERQNLDPKDSFANFILWLFLSPFIVFQALEYIVPLIIILIALIVLIILIGLAQICNSFDNSSNTSSGSSLSSFIFTLLFIGFVLISPRLLQGGSFR